MDNKIISKIIFLLFCIYFLLIFYSFQFDLNSLSRGSKQDLNQGYQLGISLNVENCSEKQLNIMNAIFE